MSFLNPGRPGIDFSVNIETPAPGVTSDNLASQINLTIQGLESPTRKALSDLYNGDWDQARQNIVIIPTNPDPLGPGIRVLVRAPRRTRQPHLEQIADTIKEQIAEHLSRTRAIMPAKPLPPY